MKSTGIPFAVLLFWLSILLSQAARGADPVLLGQWPGYQRGEISKSVQVVGKLAYVADGEVGLTILDVSSPANPTFVGEYATADETHSVEVAGNRAYVSDSKGLLVLDVSKPSSPMLLGRYDSETWAVQVIGNLAYLADAEGFQILDVSNPVKPVLIGGSVSGPAIDIQVVGTLAYVVRPGLSIFDVSDPVRPFLVSSTPVPADGLRAVQVVGDFAYVVEHSDVGSGFVIFNVSNPGKPVRVGVVGSVIASGIQVVGNLAYLGDGPWLGIVDISIPADPRYLGGYYGGKGWGGGGVQVVGDTAYLAAGSLGLHILDVSIPARTSLLRINHTGGVPSLQVTGAVGANYVIEHVPMMSATNNWIPLATLTLTNNVQTFVDTTLAKGSQRFYHARLAP